MDLRSLYGRALGRGAVHGDARGDVLENLVPDHAEDLTTATIIENSEFCDHISADNTC